MKPTLEEFAAAWKVVALDEDGNVRRGYRKALAEQYGVSMPTIDKWTRAARDAGLLEETNRTVLRLDEVRARLRAEEQAARSTPTQQAPARRSTPLRRGVRRRG